MIQPFSPQLRHGEVRRAPRRARRIAVAPLAFLALLTTAPIAGAQGLPDELTTVSYNVAGRVNASSGPIDTLWGGQDVQLAFGPTATPVMLAQDWETAVSNATHGDASAEASVFAQSEVGKLRVGLTAALTANTNASTGGSLDLRSASSRITTGRVQARWQDTAVADAADGNRTIIFLGLLTLDGNMDVNFLKPDVPAGTSYVFTAASEANLSLRLTSSSVLTSPYLGGLFGQVAGNTLPGSVFINNLPPTLIPVQMTLRDGVPFTIDYTLELLGTANSNLSTTSKSPLSTAAFIDADFTHTLRWGGIISATDAFTGLPVTDYTLTSASGFDYRNPAPVPEPTSLALLALAAPMLLRRRGAAS